VVGAPIDPLCGPGPATPESADGPAGTEDARYRCNGVIERLIRTLKTPCLYLDRFTTLEEARQITGDFIVRHNTAWLIERLSGRKPAETHAMTWTEAAWPCVFALRETRSGTRGLEMKASGPPERS
jgi:hypothetical protein